MVEIFNEEIRKTKHDVYYLEFHFTGKPFTYINKIKSDSSSKEKKKVMFSCLMFERQ